VEKALRNAKITFRKHVKTLPGSPDFVIPRSGVVVFVDGDFWHGFRFPAWRKHLSPFWDRKIAINRLRDQRSRKKLRNLGWRVVRIWQHQMKRDFEGCMQRVLQEVRASHKTMNMPRLNKNDKN
jgi:DNA mismatch endonuclease (patch repair protein)